MIKNDKEVRGIRINETEFKLSQYADDTQIFLDGSKESMEKLMSILQTFYRMSGLKVNEEKTKALWVGSMSKSHKQICPEYNLDWEKKPIKILGVTFTADVCNIWEHNAEDILHKINKMINAWSKRKLTLPGKITLIKSLMLAKFTHLFLALPNPPGELIKLLERTIYKFLWNNGPDRISRKTMVKNVRAGGLRMINVRAFITALKVSWLRRFIIYSNNDNFSHLSKVNFSKLFSLGDLYCSETLKHIRNPFWKNLVESWKLF